jgi:hypothetical protein
MAISSALGNALVPTSYGFRNVIINGNFMINQRAYASGTNLASGAYGFDRWKSNFTNTALTFTSAPQGQTVTISASGVVRQIVEQANVTAGSYVLSWFGTATGRVYNDGATPPSYQSGPLSVVLDGTANVVVEFTPASGTATLGNVQLEFGSRATPFEQRPIGVELALCQRYYYRMTGTNTIETSINRSGDDNRRAQVFLPQPMRRTLTSSDITFGWSSGYTGGSVGLFTDRSFRAVISVPTAGDFMTLAEYTVNVEL